MMPAVFAYQAIFGKMVLVFLIAKKYLTLLGKINWGINVTAFSPSSGTTPQKFVNVLSLPYLMEP